jgi:hypothetical protein
MSDINEAYDLLLNNSNCVPRRTCPTKEPEARLETTWLSDQLDPSQNNYGCSFNGPKPFQN